MASYCKAKNTIDLAIDPVLFCKLCLTEYPVGDMFQITACHCLFCEDCMRQYATVLIGEGMVTTLTCPDAKCKKLGKLSDDEIEKLVDKTTFFRYKRLYFQREVELDPHRTFCPKPGCETVCSVCSSRDQSSGDPLSAETRLLYPVPVSCPTCNFQFCSVCKFKWHAPKTCDENILAAGNLEATGVPYSPPEDADIKRCPRCSVPIERNDGCAQMMCKRCKHVFCWFCLASLDDDFLLRHYDKGPCKNKLGHSRASVIWHRTQVVGIFAGFGVLLLVASPFLLLAAPCILCLKCKMCKCCIEEEEGNSST